MLFQVVHTHTNETCPGRSPDQTKLLANWWQTLITRRAEFHGLCPWVNEQSPEGRQAKLEL